MRDLAKNRITVEEHVLWTIFHQTRDMIIKYEENTVFAGAEITREQFIILLLMEFMETEGINPIKITDLSSGLCRKVNTISSIVDRMTQKGLITKVRDLPDRRAIRLTVTQKGKQLFKGVAKSDMQLIKGMLTVFSKQDIQTLSSLLKKLKAKLGKEIDLQKIKADPQFSDPALVAGFLDDVSA